MRWGALYFVLPASDFRLSLFTSYLSLPLSVFPPSPPPWPSPPRQRHTPCVCPRAGRAGGRQDRGVHPRPNRDRFAGRVISIEEKSKGKINGLISLRTRALKSCDSLKRSKMAWETMIWGGELISCVCTKWQVRNISWIIRIANSLLEPVFKLGTPEFEMIFALAAGILLPPYWFNIVEVISLQPAQKSSRIQAFPIWKQALRSWA